MSNTKNIVWSIHWYLCGVITAEDIAQAEDDVELYVPTDTTGLKTHDGYEEVEFQQSSYLPPPQPLPFDHVKGTKMEFGKW